MYKVADIPSEIVVSAIEAQLYAVVASVFKQEAVKEYRGVEDKVTLEQVSLIQLLLSVTIPTMLHLTINRGLYNRPI